MGLLDSVSNLFGEIPILGQVASAYASHREGEMNRDWQEHMSNTTYQRQVADLKAAGLNPMLGYMKGSGAPMPSGGIPSMPDFAHSAIAAKRAEAEIDVLKAQAENLRAEHGGKVAESERLAFELKNLVPVRLQTAAFDSAIKEAEASLAGFQRAWLQSKDPAVKEMLTDYFDAKFKMVPAELRHKMAEIAWLGVQTEWYVPKLLAQGAGVAAGALGALGIGRALKGLSSAKSGYDAWKKLGPGVPGPGGGPSVFRYRGHRGSSGTSGYQYSPPKGSRWDFEKP